MGGGIDSIICKLVHVLIRPSRDNSATQSRGSTKSRSLRIISDLCHAPLLLGVHCIYSKQSGNRAAGGFCAPRHGSCRMRVMTGGKKGSYRGVSIVQPDCCSNLEISSKRLSIALRIGLIHRKSFIYSENIEIGFFFFLNISIIQYHIGAACAEQAISCFYAKTLDMRLICLLATFRVTSPYSPKWRLSPSVAST